jgi:predicted membrane-bound dolichyl-phosphate-mannose-protein mannosyltransferase
LLGVRLRAGSRRRFSRWAIAIQHRTSWRAEFRTRPPKAATVAPWCVTINKISDGHEQV